jgi:RNA recognition motif-containing protein
MPTEVFIRNLPDGTTEEFLREFLSNSVEIIEIKFISDPNPNTTDCQALVLVDLPHYDAEQLANRFNGRIVDGHTLRVVASLYNTLQSAPERGPN